MTDFQLLYSENFRQVEKTKLICKKKKKDRKESQVDDTIIEKHVTGVINSINFEISEFTLLLALEFLCWTRLAEVPEDWSIR